MTLEHLPHLLPLLNDGGIVRGWAVIEDDDFRRERSPRQYTGEIG